MDIKSFVISYLQLAISTFYFDFLSFLNIPHKSIFILFPNSTKLKANCTVNDRSETSQIIHGRLPSQAGKRDARSTPTNFTGPEYYEG